MAKNERPLRVEIPKPAEEQPAWSRVGIIGVAGFVIGIAWPKIAGVQIGPGVPGDPKGADTAAAAVEPPPTGSATPAASAAASAPAADPSAKSRELVTVGPGKIARCFDDKNKSIEDCGKLQFDPVALPKLKELASCASAMGLEGKLSIGFEIDFQKKEVHVVKGKKTTLPTSTVQGILQCAAREFANVELGDVPHKHRRYTLFYTATFTPPGKQQDAAPPGGPDAQKPEGEEGEEAAGATTSESSANGSAMVSWDTALVRKDPKDGDVISRLVRGTKVKLMGRQNDWYKIESSGKTGWVYRGAIGL